MESVNEYFPGVGQCFGRTYYWRGGRAVESREGGMESVNEYFPGAGQCFGRTYYWRGGRAVEGARLESVYTSKGYRGFESRPLRNKKPLRKQGLFVFRSRSGLAQEKG